MIETHFLYAQNQRSNKCVGVNMKLVKFVTVSGDYVSVLQVQRAISPEVYSYPHGQCRSVGVSNILVEISNILFVVY